jgi:acyl-CoA thioesterase FadM
MSVKSSVAVTTRTSDLDSLRHVNNRVYEQFCSEGRYRLLQEQGYSIEALLNQAITLRPVASFVKFFLQQKSGATLDVRTEAFPSGNGIILWNHHISQPDGQAVCHLQAETATLDHRRKSTELLPALEDSPVQLLIEDVPGFSGKCARVASSYAIIYSDMDAFGKLPIAALWRIFEEGRHMFGEQLGLSTERLVHLDTLLFWVTGTYRYYQPLNPGQQVCVHTWLERIARIRVFIRQEIRTADGAELLGASREEHLVVSLSEARAKPLPSELATMLQAYVEYQG